MIKAIDTKYKGHLFRSRLEARWAVFFDAIGVKYEYEPQGFEIDGCGRYLPDFFLPDYRLWVEIKPTAAGEVEKMKCFHLAHETGNPCLLIQGPPKWDDATASNCNAILFPGWRNFTNRHTNMSLSPYAHFVHDTTFSEERGLAQFLTSVGYWDEEQDYIFEYSWERNKALCEADSKYFSEKYGREDTRYKYGLNVQLCSISLNEEGKLEIGEVDRLEKSKYASDVALSARFEFGQTPNPKAA